MPDTFVINIGDQFARWTSEQFSFHINFWNVSLKRLGSPPILDDIFVSTRHRVLPALSKDRYSIPFFFGCDHDVPLIPPETCVTPDRPAKYETMTAGAYVHMRLSDIYKVKET